MQIHVQEKLKQCEYINKNTPGLKTVRTNQSIHFYTGASLGANLRLQWQQLEGSTGPSRCFILYGPLGPTLRIRNEMGPTPPPNTRWYLKVRIAVLTMSIECVRFCTCGQQPFNPDRHFDLEKGKQTRQVRG